MLRGFSAQWSDSTAPGFSTNTREQYGQKVCSCTMRSHTRGWPSPALPPSQATTRSSTWMTSRSPRGIPGGVSGVDAPNGMMTSRTGGESGLMIAMLAMSSTPRALLACLVLLLGGCAARLPPYGAPGQPLALHPVPDEVFTLPDGTRLPARVWLPPGGQVPAAIILALHGFNDSRDQWALPGPVFAAAGIALYAPDQRGFGDSAARETWPGVTALVDDADAMAQDLHRRFPTTPLYIMGESMGGAIAMDLAARPSPPPIAGTIMLSPAVWGRKEQGLVLESALWAANGLIPGYRLTAGDVPAHIRASDNRDALIALARDPLTIRSTQVAVLGGLVDLMDSAQQAAPHVQGRSFIAYGAHDELVPASAMAVAWAHLPPDTRRAVYPNGYHLLMRDRDRQSVIGDVIAWIRNPDALLPSGADIAASAWATRYNPGGGIEF